MPTRMIREGLIHSESFLSLKDNADRLAYVSLLLVADDLGNLEATPFRLLRLWRDWGVDTTEKVAKTLAELLDHHLVELYDVDDRRYLHLPKFGQRVRHIKRAVPHHPSQNQLVAKIKTDESLAKASLRTDEGRPEVEVEVEVEVEELKSQRRLSRSQASATDATNGDQENRKAHGSRLPEDWSLPESWKDWAVATFGMTPQEVVRESLNFADYWISVPGQRGRKADWQRTFKVWMRRSREKVSRVS